MVWLLPVAAGFDEGVGGPGDIVNVGLEVDVDDRIGVGPRVVLGVELDCGSLKAAAIISSMLADTVMSSSLHKGSLGMTLSIEIKLTSSLSAGSMGDKGAIDPGTSAVSESDIVYPSVVCQAFPYEEESADSSASGVES